MGLLQSGKVRHGSGQEFGCEGERQWQADWERVFILRRERHDLVSGLQGRVQKWGEGRRTKAQEQLDPESQRKLLVGENVAFPLKTEERADR